VEKSYNIKILFVRILPLYAFRVLPSVNFGSYGPSQATWNSLLTGRYLNTTGISLDTAGKGKTVN